MKITSNTQYISVRKTLPKEFDIEDMRRLRLEAFRGLSEKIYGYSGGDDMELVIQFHFPPRTHEGKQYIFAVAYINIMES